METDCQTRWGLFKKWGRVNGRNCDWVNLDMNQAAASEQSGFSQHSEVFVSILRSLNNSEFHFFEMTRRSLSPPPRCLCFPVTVWGRWPWFSSWRKRIGLFPFQPDLTLGVRATTCKWANSTGAVKDPEMVRRAAAIFFTPLATPQPSSSACRRWCCSRFSPQTTGLTHPLNVIRENLQHVWLCIQSCPISPTHFALFRNRCYANLLQDIKLYLWNRHQVLLEDPNLHCSHEYSQCPTVKSTGLLLEKDVLLLFADSK